MYVENYFYKANLTLVEIDFRINMITYLIYIDC